MKAKNIEVAPCYEILVNPARVVPAQEKLIKFFQDTRYVPVIEAASGFVLLKDRCPNEPEHMVQTVIPLSLTTFIAAAGVLEPGPSAAMAMDDESQPPEPFEYNA